MLEVRNISDGAILLSGKVELEAMAALRRELEGRIVARSNSELVINLQSLKTFNSALLSLILCLIRRARAVHCELSFDDVPAGLFDMARVGGIEALLRAR